MEAGPAWSRLSFRSLSGQHISPGEGPRAEEGSLRNWEDTGHSLLGSGGRASAFISSVSSFSLWHPVAAAGVPPLLSHHLSGPPDPPLVTCVLSIFLGNAIHSDHFPSVPLSLKTSTAPVPFSLEPCTLWPHNLLIGDINPSE